MVGTYQTFHKTLANVSDVYDNIQKGTLKEKMARDSALIQAQGSIVRLLSTFIIEPTIIVSRGLREEEIIEKLNELNVDIFSSFYLQAFNVLTNIYGFKSETAFDVLSSHGGIKSLEELNTYSIEDFDQTLDILPIKQSSKDYLSMEAKNGKKRKKDKKAPEKKIARGEIRDSKGISVPSIIQKEIEINHKVTPSNGEASYDIIIPVTIKATVIYSDFSNIETMISTNDKEKGFDSRLDEYRAGMISLKDLVFADDLIKEYKNNKIKDKDNLIDFMETRASAANSDVLTKGYIGLSKFYGILIVSKNQMNVIESRLGGKISKPKYREMLMQQTKSLLINVVDTDWERVEIHTKDLKGTSDVSYKVISKKKGGTDSSELVDIFKAISSNKPPVF